MLVNFALDAVGTKVTSDKVSTDGHECTNLISTNWHLRRKGYLAEHFIKPPVNITLEFPCNIWIHSVLVSPLVGQQQSSQFELYSASKPVAKKNHTGHKFKRLKGDDITTGKPANAPTAGTMTNTPAPPIFYPVSRVSFTGSNRICFYNPNFGAHVGHDITHDETVYEQKVVMRHFRKELTAACSHLTLRIIRTQHGSTAAVSNIDIWGVPAASVSTDNREDVINKYIQFLKPVTVMNDRKQEGHSDCKKTKIDLSSDSQEEQGTLDIPEEFIDPLTCDVMAIPMLLPCGKNVDMSTLDRFFNAEASYGRQPRDPFTGVEFSNTSRPLPNGALKARIDQFLMKHKNDAATSTIARTVGAAGDTFQLGKRKTSENVEISSLVFPHSAAKVASISEAKAHQLNGNKQRLESLHSGQLSLTDTRLECNSACRNVQNVSGRATADVHKRVGNLESKVNKDSSSSSTSSNSIHNHESQLQSSLNSALSSILSGLPTYISCSSNSSQGAVDNNLCSRCKIILTAETVSYSLPCHHFVCRQCLTKHYQASSSVSCTVCAQIWDKSQVVRSHQKS